MGETQCHHCPQTAAYRSRYLSIIFRNYRLSRLFSSVADNLTFIPVFGVAGGTVAKLFFEGLSDKVIHNGIDLNIFRPCECAESGLASGV